MRLYVLDVPGTMIDRTVVRTFLDVLPDVALACEKFT